MKLCDDSPNITLLIIYRNGNPLEIFRIIRIPLIGTAYNRRIILYYTAYLVSIPIYEETNQK